MSRMPDIKDIAAQYQPLFNHMQEEHGLILLCSEMDEIIKITEAMRSTSSDKGQEK